MLLRLRRATAGPPTKLADLSAGLNVATNCQDTHLPYPLSAPFADRPGLLDQGLTLGDAALYPFTHATVASNSIAHDCMLWPGAAGISPPSEAPMPDVPALILDGRLDLRTPLENGRELARELPHASIVTVAGTGHDELDSDVTGCTALALKRFVDGKLVGDPCRGKTNAVESVPDRSSHAERVPRRARHEGVRGRVVSAVLVSAIDARVALLQDLYAGFSTLRGGGLRGGSYALRGSDGLVLRRLPLRRERAGQRRRLRLGAGDAKGRVRVDGPGRLDGGAGPRTGTGARAGRSAGGASRAAPRRGPAARAPRHCSAAPSSRRRGSLARDQRALPAPLVVVTVARACLGFAFGLLPG